MNPLDIQMEACINYTGSNPIIVNMGVRFREEKSEKPMGWDVSSRIYGENNDNTSVTVPGSDNEHFFRERKITYRTVVKRLLGDFILEHQISLNPFGGLDFVDGGFITPLLAQAKAYYRR